MENVSSSSSNESFSVTTTRSSLTLNTPVTQVLYVTIGSSGFIFNLLSLCVMLAYAPLRRYSSSAYIVALSTTGGLVSLILALNIVFEDPSGSYRADDPWSVLVCKLWYRRGLLWMVMMANVYVVVALALDQYAAVVYPLFYRRRSSSAGRVFFPALLITSAVIMGPVAMIPHVLTFTQITESGQCISLIEAPNWGRQFYLGLYNAAMQYFIPLGSVVFVYSKIAWTIHKGTRLVSDQRTDNSGPFQAGNKSDADPPFQISRDVSAVSASNAQIHSLEKEKKNYARRTTRDSVLRTSFWIAICYLCCHSMHQISYFLFIVKLIGVNRKSPEFYIRFVLIYLHSTLNPLIYYVKLDKFKEGIRWIACDRLKLLFCRDSN